jgi:tetratricopeptide (TPR) repeat protein
MQSLRQILGVLTVVALAASQALAADAPEIASRGTRYDACVAKIDKKPEDAFEDARVWNAQGGGAPADHCAALALVALHEYGEAAKRFEALARGKGDWTVDERAQLLDQAGNAWLLENEPVNGESLFSAALKLAPRNANIWIGRARARALQKNWVGVEEDAAHALTFDAKRADAYVLRAEARKAQGKSKDARGDIEAALKIEPSNPDALVERGIMKLAAGDKNGARADWLQVLVHAPDGAAGDAARAQIQQLEVNVNR